MCIFVRILIFLRRFDGEVLWVGESKSQAAILFQGGLIRHC